MVRVRRALDGAIAEAEHATSGLLVLAMGGTAVGTGLNTRAGFRDLVAPATGAVIAVGVAHVLRGPAKAEEAAASEGTPLNRAI
jgi:fumarate hydratase class II